MISLQIYNTEHAQSHIEIWLSETRHVDIQRQPGDSRIHHYHDAIYWIMNEVM
jgi:hypothetical protein